MNRRVWSAAVVVAAVLVFGSYLAYTQYLVREIRAQNEINSRVYELAQRGLLEEDGATLALLDMQALLDSAAVPTVVFSPSGEVYAVRNLPFGDGLATRADTMRVRRFAAELESLYPENYAPVPGAGAVYYGDPPILGWLRWVPYLQVGGAVLLVLVTATMLRVNLRAERERFWAAMARELAHQMGTPLSALSGWLEVLALPESERASMASETHIAQVMRSDIERLERVSRRFELIGKPQVLETVQIRDLVEELECYFRPRLPKLGHGIRLRSRVSRRVPAIRANGVLLGWALENVVKNAVDALAGRGGTILIAADTNGAGEVHVHIADDGPGIPSGMLDRIFEPGVTTKSSGWGVGLSLTQRIVQDLHGGRVMVRARKRGGTAFEIILPIQPSPRSRRRAWRF